MSVNDDKPRVMPLAQAVNYLQHSNNIILHYDNRVKIDIWSPNIPKKVPITLRRAVVKYKEELKTLMDNGAVCADHELHRRAWHYHEDGRFAWCALCRHFVEVGIC